MKRKIRKMWLKIIRAIKKAVADEIIEMDYFIGNTLDA